MLSGCHHLPGCNLSSQQIPGRGKKALSLPSLNTHPIKSYFWFSFHSVLLGAQGIILCKCHCFTLFIYFYFPLLLIHLFFLSDSGADDLLPILSFVALQCQCPQLVSECAALEEFIHEGWVIMLEEDDEWRSPLSASNTQKFVLSRCVTVLKECAPSCYFPTFPLSKKQKFANGIILDRNLSQLFWLITVSWQIKYLPVCTSVVKLLFLCAGDEADG